MLMNFLNITNATFSIFVETHLNFQTIESTHAEIAQIRAIKT